MKQNVNGEDSMEENLLEEIVAPLLDWYRANCRRLPWRENRDPYRVWVSEIMLQQTRVEAVIPYYERFMEQLPSIDALAACGDEELFKLWEGLGYYSRARNLKAAAQMICAKHQGRFPQEYDKIRALPGIGAYTAGAIASIAFEAPAAAVDGNVLRVVTRLTQDAHDITDAKFRSQITRALEQVYPAKGRGDFTQSLMELGAVVCVPGGRPKCEECPVRALCRAHGSGTQLQYPVKKKKAPRRVEQKTVLVMCMQDRIALRKRENSGILAGMWELPNVDGTLCEAEIAKWLAQRGMTAHRVQRAADGRQMKHIFTHVEWHMTCWNVCCDGAQDCGCGGEFTWVTAGQLEGAIALPTAFKKVYRAADVTLMAKDAAGEKINWLFP